MELFEKDSAVDLVLRGLPSDRIMEMTGVDVGRNGQKLRDMPKYVDRIAYQQQHILERVGPVRFTELLVEYGEGRLTKEQLFVACGITAKSRLAVRSLSEAVGCADAYRTAYARQREIARERMRATMMDRYGCSEAAHIPGLTEKRKATCMARYGVDSPCKSPEIVKKIRNTMKARYGAETTLQSAELSARCRKTMTERYGAPHMMQCPELREKLRATFRERYDVDYAMQSREIQEKARVTSREHYNVDNPMQSDVVKERLRQSLVAKYGTDNVMSLPEVKAKVRATCQERYGTDYSLQSPAVRAKAEATSMARYGCKRPSSSLVVQERMQATMVERYGVPFPSLSREIRAKAEDTVFEHYGVRYPAQDAAILAKSLQTKLEHGKFASSAPEEALYDRLLAVYGADDVLRQYNGDARYPFRCDFYVRSRDLFIELNGYWMHGNHWYGLSEIDDAVLAEFRSRSGPQYDVFDAIWTISDVKKRETAKQNNLNYVVFWGNEGQDVDLWFAMGCPDGRDWDRMYSWLPERELTYDGGWPETLKQQGRSIPAAARMANWREFYKRELALWDLNYDNKWGTVQARLYANRFKYIGKLPDELTDREILRGLNIAGMVRAYSHFDNSGMVEFLRDYDIKSLYDPCAGWGERMLTCMVSGVEYTGTDINPASVDAHMLLLDKYREYAPGRAYVALGDSAERDMTAGVHEAVFTCPPYGDREIYTDSGAENLDPDAFLDWWRRVAEHSVSGTTRAFAYQIDQVWKDRMNAVVESLGWRLDRQIPVGRNRVSHMTRSRGDGTKHNFEEVQVFVR